jgi:aldose 1-epimerase
MVKWEKKAVGDAVLVKIRTGSGFSAELLSTGATLVSFKAPDRNGKVDDIVLGFDDPAEYLANRVFFGSTAGRFANRIARGRFTCEGKEYHLDCNNPPNHLHGGIRGFDILPWETEVFSREDSVSVVFSLRSADGDQGYPGNLAVMATYVMDGDGTLSMEYYAETDALTPVNLTNHAYWNLAGAGKGSVSSHHLRLNCDTVLDIDNTLIPTGKLIKVEGTPFDFRETTPLLKGMDLLGGYDHCFALPPAEGDLRLCAVLEDPACGRRMTISTTQPGVQIYTGNNLNGIKGKNGQKYDRFGGICLETQNWPDAVNHPDFPDPFLKPGEIYRQRTVHGFSFF